MDESIKELLSQYGSAASSVDALEQTRKDLGLSSVSDIAEISRMQEIARKGRSRGGS